MHVHMLSKDFLLYLILYSLLLCFFKIYLSFLFLAALGLHCYTHFSSVTQSYLILCDAMDCSICQASLSVTNSWSLLKLTSIKSVIATLRLSLVEASWGSILVAVCRRLIVGASLIADDGV